MTRLMGYLYLGVMLFWISITGVLFLIVQLVAVRLLGAPSWPFTPRLTRLWAKAYHRLIGLRVQVSGCMPNSNGCLPTVYVSNHYSTLDIPLVIAVNPCPVSLLAKMEVRRIPVIGYLASTTHILVDRRSDESRSKSYEQMLRALQQGRSVHVFIEGTRNRTPEALATVYDGAFRLAIDAKAPIHPLVIAGSERVLSPLQPFRAFPYTVTCHWLPLTETLYMAPEDLPVIKTQVCEALRTELTRLGAPRHPH